jgi:hypothetical protein
MLCVPSPNYLEINIEDNITGENVFDNGTFTRSQLEILTSPQSQFPFTFNEDIENNVFKIFPIQATGPVEFEIVLNNEITIPLTAEIVLNESCGSIYYFVNIMSDDPSIVTILTDTNNLTIKI